MSEKEDKVETDIVLKKTQEIDIYSDILVDEDKCVQKLEQKVQNLTSEKALLIKSLNSLQKSYEKKEKDYQEMRLKYEKVSFNASALFKTAQAEIGRKDRKIQELRRENDNLLFRKIPAQKALRRAHLSVSPKKRSPIKEKGAASSERPLRETSTFQDSKQDPKEDSGQKTLQEAEKSRGNEVREQEKTEGGNPSQPSSSCGNNMKYLPALQGPVTEYSKRLYKKVHGVSPQKPTCPPHKCLESEDDDELPQKTGLKRMSTSPTEQTSTKVSPTKNEINIQQKSKFPRIASKLQEEVKEIIKLGAHSANTNSLFISNKVSHETKNRKSVDSSPSVTLTQQSLKPSTPKQLILQCDFRSKNSKEIGSPPQNSVSSSETLTNILRNQKAGMYDTKENEKLLAGVENTTVGVSSKVKLVANTDTQKDVERDDKKLLISKVNNCSKSKNGNKNLQKVMGNRPNRLLANLSRRISKKSVVSPVTFGKLIPFRSESSKNVVASKSNEKDSKSSEDESLEKSRKRKLSELPSPIKTVPSPESENSKVYESIRAVKKRITLTSLFGDSPSKSNPPDEVFGEKQVENVRIPSPTYPITHTGSPIFPNSPSLDSDNPEDLVIDTTVCSQNTSPRVSESGIFHLEPLPVSQSKTQNDGPICTSNVIDSSAETSKQLNKKEITSTEKVSSEKDKEVLETNKFDNNEIVSLNNKEETVLPLVVTPISEAENKKHSLPDLFECFSLDNESQLLGKSIPSSNLTQPVNSVTDLPAESSLSLDELLKPASPKTNIGSGHLALEHSKVENISKVKREEIPRFVPSPPQLTMVSAFRHSENSVFSITEDTVAFVSKLTRVRDISPIRTPDKRKRPLSPTPQSEVLEPKGSEPREGHFLNNTTSEFLKPSISAHALKSANKELERAITPECETDKTHSLLIPKVQSSDSSEPAVNGEIKHNSNILKVKVSCDIPSGSNNTSTNLESNSSQNSFTKKNKKYNEDVAVDTSKKTTLQNNVFKRARPVRLIAQCQSTLEFAINCNNENTNVQTFLSKSSTEQVSRKENIGKQSAKESNRNDSFTDQGINSKHTNSETTESASLQPFPEKQGQASIQVEHKESSKEIEEIVEKLPTSSEKGNNEAAVGFETKDMLISKSKASVIKLETSLYTSPENGKKNTFKRSESLKTMCKPVARINYDTLSNKEQVKETCLNVDKNHLKNSNSQEFSKYKSRKRNEISNKIIEINLMKDRNVINSAKYKSRPGLGKKQSEGKTNNSPYTENEQENIGVKELEQMPHIASINQRVRVSKCQGDTERKKHALASAGTQSVENVPREVSNKKQSKVNQRNKDPPVPVAHGKDTTLVPVNEQISDNLNTKQNDKQTVRLGSDILEIPTCKPISESNLSSNIHSELKSKLPDHSESRTEQISTKPSSREKFNHYSDRSESESSGSNYRNKSDHCSRRSLSKSPDPSDSRSKSNDQKRSQSKSPVLRDRRKFNHHPRTSQSKSPDPNDRSKSNHQRRCQSKSPDPRDRSKSNHRPRRSQSKSPDLNDRSKSNHQRRCQSKSPDPRDRSKSNHRPRRSQSKSPDLDDRRSKSNHHRKSPDPRDRSKSNHRPRRSQSKSPDPNDRNKSNHQSRGQIKTRNPRDSRSKSNYQRRYQSKSPKPNYRNKSNHHRICSSSKGSERNGRSRSNRYPRRPHSKSPDPNYRSKSKHYEHRSKSKSPYDRSSDQQVKRSRSRTSSPEERSKSKTKTLYDHYQRERGRRQYRSRSKSPCHSHRKILRNHSPEGHSTHPKVSEKHHSSRKPLDKLVVYPKESEVIGKNKAVSAAMSYSDELDQLRKELELVIGKLNKSDKTVAEDSPQSGLSEQQMCEKSQLQCTADSIELSKQIKVSEVGPAQTITTPHNENQFLNNMGNTILVENEENKQDSSVEEQDPQLDSPKNPHQTSATPQTSSTPKPIIRLSRRKIRNLSDSDVIVVSSFTNRTSKS